MIRVALADDHALIRDGIKRVLSAYADLSVVAEATNAGEVMELARRGGFDVLVLDLSMPGRAGIDLIGDVRRERPRLPILVLTMHDEQSHAVRAMRAGASGYLTKGTASKELVDAIHRVAAGRLFVNEQVAELLAYDVRPVSETLPHKNLTNREFEIFELLVEGRAPSEIAERLCLSVKTVSTHKTRVLQKLGLTSVADLVRYAIKHGLSESGTPG